MNGYATGSARFHSTVKMRERNNSHTLEIHAKYKPSLMPLEIDEIEGGI